MAPKKSQSALAASMVPKAPPKFDFSQTDKSKKKKASAKVEECFFRVRPIEYNRSPTGNFEAQWRTTYHEKQQLLDAMNEEDLFLEQVGFTDEGAPRTWNANGGYHKCKIATIEHGHKLFDTYKTDAPDSTELANLTDIDNYDTEGINPTFAPKQVNIIFLVHDGDEAIFVCGDTYPLKRQFENDHLGFDYTSDVNGHRGYLKKPEALQASRDDVETLCHAFGWETVHFDNRDA